MIGLAHKVHPSSVEEFVPANTSPADVARLLARLKAHDIARLYPGQCTLSADTIVVLDGQILNKPTSEEEAFEMLSMLSGRTHEVITGFMLCCYNESQNQQDASFREFGSHESTMVTFSKLEEHEIRAYIATGSPMDKAGAYGIQDDLGSLFVSRIHGDYYNVVGLPIQALYTALKSFAPELVSELLKPKSIPV